MGSSIRDYEKLAVDIIDAVGERETLLKHQDVQQDLD